MQVIKHRAAVGFTVVLLASGVVAVVASIGFSYQRLHDTRAALARICAYQADGTVQGNVRAVYLHQLGEAFEASLLTAAKAWQERGMQDTALEFRATEKRLRTLGTKVAPRAPIHCG